MSHKEMTKPDYLVSAFPGCGRTTMVSRHKLVIDTDISAFDPFKYPHNLVEYARAQIDARRLMLTSSHHVYRKALIDAGISYYLVYPSLDQMDDYFDRYSKKWFPANGLSKLFKDNWGIWLAEMRKQTSCIHVELKPGEFLSDRIEVVKSEEGDHQVFRLK